MGGGKNPREKQVYECGKFSGAQNIMKQSGTQLEGT